MVIRITGASVRYGGVHALRDVDLVIGRGERVGLLGASGAGKSTLLGLLSGLLAPDTGSVEVFGNDLSHLGGRRLRQHRRQVGTITQHLDMALPLRVVHNINAGRLGSWSTMAALASLIWPSGRDEAAAVLSQVGLADRLLDRTDGLSGGERQRVAVARVLRQKPALVLADEPTSSVDPRLANEVMDLLCASGTNTDGETNTVVVSVHAPELARRHTSRIIGLSDGTVVFDRPPDEVSESEIAALYVADR